MVKENRNLYKEILIKVNIKMVDLMDLGHINGQTVLFMRVHLKMVLGTEKENGLIIKLSILEITHKVLKKVMVNSTFQVEIFTKEILFQIVGKVTEKCFGLMGLFIKDNGRMVIRMEKDKFIYLEIKLWVVFFRTAF